MRTFKKIDFWISCILLIGFSILILVIQGNTLFIGYFVVGGWQVISMLVHVWQHWFTHKGGVRYVYHWIALISLVTIPLGSFWILLFTAAPMAIYYAWICHAEVYVKMQRPINLLK